MSNHWASAGKLVEKSVSMYTHALHKAFKPFVDAINSRLNRERLIADWYPLSIDRAEWWEDSKQVGKVAIYSGLENKALCIIEFCKNGTFKVIARTYAKVFNAADPQSLPKIKEEVINILSKIIKEVDLHDLPTGF